MEKRSKLILAGVAAGAGAALIMKRRGMVGNRTFQARSRFLVECSKEEAYRFWRDVENLPIFMTYIDSVQPIDDRQFEWIATGPGGQRFHGLAEIEGMIENERIDWRSSDESAFPIRGSVEFWAAFGRRGTVVTHSVEYTLPAGQLGKILLSILGRNPDAKIREDLRRFKALMEAGEIPTTEGQPAGPRSTTVKAMKAATSQEPIEWPRSRAS